MNIGFILSGGGARGIAHLGVLKALDEMGLRPTRIAGTSAGAIAGAMTSAGYTPDEVLDILQTTNLMRFMRPAFNRMGFLKLDRLEALYRKYLPDDSFESLKIPMTIAATDLMGGQTVYFNSGSLIRPLMASCCLPGIFEPILYQKRLYVDGGVLNNMPLDPLEDCCDLFVGSHVNPFGITERPITSIKSVMERSLYLAINKSSQQQFAKYHLLIEPPELKNYTVLDVKKAREIFRVGYLYTRQLAPQVEQLLMQQALA
ncbi:MAG: patatin-like phospholipase family protein [Cytophagaceae bacterium]|nr:patatin-like phospholipase family protein [Cytophagaceae bacterium]